jgi:hypothetical protein
MRGPAISTVIYRPSLHHVFSFAANDLDFPILVMEAWHGRHFPDQAYHRIPTLEEPIPSSFLACLEHYARSKGKSLQLHPVPDVLFATYKGETSAREKLAFGTELHGRALKLSLGTQ